MQWGIGRDQDGLAEARLAFENDPLSAYATTVLSLALATVNRRDEAVLQAKNAVQLDPESFLAKWELACAYHWNGQHEEAIAIFELGQLRPQLGSVGAGPCVHARGS